MTYIGSLIISLCLIKLSEQYRPKKIKVSRKRRIILPNWFALMAILVFAIIAGLRDSSIGRDVTVYVIPVFTRASRYSSVVQVLQQHNVDIGYEILAFISSRISDDFHFFNFLTSFITISCIYCFFKRNLNGKYIVLSMFVFFCLFYNNTFNVVRQWLAIGIVAVATTTLEEKKYLKYIIGCIFASMFHISGIVGLIYPITSIILNKQKGRIGKTALIVAGIGIGLSFFSQAILLLNRIGILSVKYIDYIDTSGNSSIFNQVISRIVIIILGVVLYEKLDKEDSNNHIIFCYLLIDLLLGCSAVLVGDASRFSLYFGIWQCVFVPRIIIVLEKLFRKEAMILVYFLVVVYYLSYWVYCIPIRNLGSTYPYVSDIIKWLN